MKQLWQWTATDKFGKSRNYQCHAPDTSESTMLAHLKEHYRNVTITNLHRIADGEYKPPSGPIESHTYSFGIYDRVLGEMGIARTERMLDKLRAGTSLTKPIERKPIERRPIIAR